MSSTKTLTVLGKRKAHNPTTYVLHLHSDPEVSATHSSHSEDDDENESESNESERDSEPRAKSKGKGKEPVLINGKLVFGSKRKYACTYEGCNKAYTKPSRLEEHERSHNGERPFVCPTCSKSYLRESHLQAHQRSHVPESERPLACTEAGCNKRFWTAQHLKRHVALHMGAKPFACIEPGCSEAYAKHHQLRAHIIAEHAPPGTKAYQCYHEDCPRTFATTQHLKAHMKTHDTTRYTCAQCPASSDPSSTSRPYFSTWTLLRAHIKSAHPPRCTEPECADRKPFASQKGLRAHQKLHEQRAVEEMVMQGVSRIEGDDADDEDEEERPRKKRRGGEMGRDWVCEWEGCTKDFKSKKALTTHVNVAHLGRRDFVCTEDGCGRAFGYKHLLQRHQAKEHAQPQDEDSSSSDDDEEDNNPSASNNNSFSIDALTGLTYERNAEKDISQGRRLRCPFPDLHPFGGQSSASTSTASCGYAFSRAYDLRRHLEATHGLVEVDKSIVERWVKARKAKAA